ncbi:rRNA-processing protein FYV7 [Metschnikowia bicuspidata var. bicuspidata NRRL YB-4993]|uniref:rRNA-processing protein FYV7 n=1 Tax=Metschnikowia bicuspidata var. bicuspidata NRRL YB-4993 TaxID=869754 RepID=A0A1A0HFP2_9ASCO|nr:rRNA-processing protein FYV7 [Metschnikowia bicuspidata var. bicuspidata NRRL YB-4993]OBA22805.1 rRNA-processing protein FYV7 [Metschnikowia bicuspidata var. bicuspidata NRRL YB-4993]
MAQEKRKPFKGKKLHKDLRDYKNQEIKRSLVHRARLRKSYFKLLEKEGIPAGQEYPGLASAAEEDPRKGARDDRHAKTDGSSDDEKQLNFAERAKLARERKEQKREDELRRVQERRQKIEQSQKDREKKKLSLQQRTRRGQPVMGPKISDLLDKIRHNG